MSEQVQVPGDLTVDETVRIAAMCLLVAHGARVDAGAWHALVAATAAATLGSTDALLVNRPGSWGASLLGDLLRGTVGWEDDVLREYVDDAVDQWWSVR